MHCLEDKEANSSDAYYCQNMGKTCLVFYITNGEQEGNRKRQQKQAERGCELRDGKGKTDGGTTGQEEGAQHPLLGKRPPHQNGQQHHLHGKTTLIALGPAAARHFDGFAHDAGIIKHYHPSEDRLHPNHHDESDL